MPVRNVKQRFILCKQLDFFALGIYEATFRVEKCETLLYLGLVPAAVVTKALTGGELDDFAYSYSSWGSFWVNGNWIAILGQYGTGDVITIRLSLDANTVAFGKNGADLKSVETAGDAYVFAFYAGQEGDAVTIIQGI